MSESPRQARIVRLRKIRGGRIGSIARRSMRTKAQDADDRHRRAGERHGPERLVADPGHGQHEREEGSGEDHRAGDVEPRVRAAGEAREGDQREREGHETHGDVDPEHPRPAPVVGDETADDGPDDDGDGERGADDRHVARRCRGLVTRAMIVCDMSWMPAEPRPCRTRAAMSQPGRARSRTAEKRRGRPRSTRGTRDAARRCRRACRARAASRSRPACSRP